MGRDVQPLRTIFLETEASDAGTDEDFVAGDPDLLRIGSADLAVVNRTRPSGFGPGGFHPLRAVR
jgi:hypothetical protein